MKTVKLGVLAITLAFIIGFCMPVQAAENLDGLWWKGRLQGGQSRAFGTDLTGEVTRYRLEGGDFYFKTCSDLVDLDDDPDLGFLPVVSDCLGIEYVGFGVADFDDDGEFGELDEFGAILVATCGLEETAFRAFLEIEDLDPGLLTELAVADFELLGEVKYDGNDVPRLRANSGNGSVAWEIGVFTEDPGVVGVFDRTEWILGRKGGVKADVVAVEDLPFDPVSIAFLRLFGDTRCVSDLPEGTPIANAGPDQLEIDFEVGGVDVLLNGSGSLPDGEVSYVWTFVEFPGAIAPIWVDNLVETPIFAALQTGTYVVQLVVALPGPPVLFSLPDFVTIVVIEPDIVE
jgi:hypothetical protein